MLVALKYKLLSQASAVTDIPAMLRREHSDAKDLEFLSHTRPPVFLSLLIFLILCETQGHGQFPSPTFSFCLCNGSQLKSQFMAPSSSTKQTPVRLLCCFIIASWCWAIRGL